MRSVEQGRSGLTLDRVVEGEDVDPLSVLDVLARVNVAQVSELDSQVVSGDYRKIEARRRTSALVRSTIVCRHRARGEL